MKNKEIHAKFDDGNIRDFLSAQIGHGYDGEVDSIKARIAQLEEELETAKKSQAARDLIKAKGWKEFDVGDEIEDYKHGQYFSFIGTEKEREELGL